MEQKYPINKYSKAIIEGLGYTVVMDYRKNPNFSCIQDVDRIVNKKTNNALQRERTRYSYGFDEGSYEFQTGCMDTETMCHYGDEREIRLEIYGNTVIVNGDIMVFIDYNHRDNGNMRIMVNIKGQKNIEFLYSSRKSGEKLPRIIVKEDSADRSIDNITPYAYHWCDEFGGHDIKDGMVDQIINSIIKSFKKYKNGALFNEKMIKAINIVRPALVLYAIDFVSEWRTLMTEKSQAIRKKQRDTQNRIKELDKEYHENIKEIELLKIIRGRLTSDIRRANRINK